MFSNCITGAKPTFGGRFGENEERVYWLDNVDCNGTEHNLFACQSPGKGNHNCGSHQRAGVICTGMCSNLICVLSQWPCSQLKVVRVT